MPKRATPHVKLKRAYDTAARSDGHRILVFAAKDAEHNNAVALKEYLERHQPRMKPAAKQGMKPS